MRIRILQGVAGDDFSWAPGDEVDLPAEEAAKWADGYRAEWADPATEARADEVVEDAGPAVAEKAAPRSRGGGRGRRTETR
ncbi:hypothetical protein ACFWCB_26350 [Streptomyces sp. NPDC060048]|uniref:hypothetical protein n=1 Tax=unclassified Streptomyces TaxID=2593676 RepID=UPI0036B0896C